MITFEKEADGSTYCMQYETEGDMVKVTKWSCTPCLVKRSVELLTREEFEDMVAIKKGKFVEAT